MKIDVINKNNINLYLLGNISIIEGGGLSFI